MQVVLDKIRNSESQYQVVKGNKEVVQSGFSTWEEAMRYVLRNS